MSNELRYHCLTVNVPHSNCVVNWRWGNLMKIVGVPVKWCQRAWVLRIVFKFDKFFNFQFIFDARSVNAQNIWTGRKHVVLVFLVWRDPLNLRARIVLLCLTQLDDWQIVFIHFQDHHSVVWGCHASGESDEHGLSSVPVFLFSLKSSIGKVEAVDCHTCVVIDYLALVLFFLLHSRLLLIIHLSNFRN